MSLTIIRTTRRSTPRRGLVALCAATALAAGALLSQPALAMPGSHGGAHAMHAGGMGGGMGMAMAHPRMAERMLDAVDATPEQRTQIRSLVEAARTDLQAQRETGRSLREQAMALFTQPTVDARAAEALRQQMLAQHDNASKRMTQLMLDVSRVLTPAQRQQLAERMAQRREMMQRHQGERRQMREQREHRHAKPQT